MPSFGLRSLSDPAQALFHRQTSPLADSPSVK
jgi:hypothetical protein